MWSQKVLRNFKKITDEHRLNFANGLPIGLMQIFLIALFIHSVLPFFTIYHFVTLPSGKRPSSLWVVAMLLGWGIPAMIYAIKHMQTKLARAAGWIGLFSVVVGGLGMLKFTSGNKGNIGPLVKSQIVKIKDSLYRAQNPDNISEQDYLNAYSQLDQIVKKTTGLVEIQKSTLLIELIDHYLSDKVISRKELSDWQSIYNSFELVDGEKLSTYVRETKRGRQPASLPF